MNRPALGDWDRAVKKPEERCAACGEVFPAEFEVLSLLSVSESGFERRDYHPNCPLEGEERAFSRWLWRRAPAAPVSRRLDLGFLSEFFRRLIERDREEEREVQWIVALLLWRKKILELVDEQVTGEGKAVMSLRFRGEEAVVAVSDPGIDDARALAIKDDLGRLFSLGGPGEPPPPPREAPAKTEHP